MFVGEKLFLNLLVLMVSTLYWYISGHYVASLLGYLLVLEYLYSEKSYMLSYAIAIVTLIAIITFFFLDYYNYKDGDGVLHFGTGILYMIVIYLKSRAIFNAE